MTKTKKSVSPRSRLHQAVKKAVVPHTKNQYRPHLIRAHGLVGVITLVVIAQIGSNLIQTGTVLGQQSDVTRQELLIETNARRLDDGKPALKLSDTLSTAATMKARDMFTQQYWAHNAPNGRTPWHWFKKADYSYAYAGENLAKGFSTSDGVVTAWMNSPEHRENLLDERYKDVGFAVISGTLNGEVTRLVVAFYGTPKAQAASLGLTDTTNPHAHAANGSTSLITRLGIGIQSMTPSLIGSIVLLLITAGVALVAHAYRRNLPKPLRKSWYRHHGLYKAIGMTCFVVVLVALYGSGQI
jgi:uncharacterized protein YkwD